MQTRAFRMNLNPGQADEYRRRHDEIWPELAQALLDAGVVDYRIFLTSPPTRCSPSSPMKTPTAWMSCPAPR